MAAEDAVRWNQKYADAMVNPNHIQAPRRLLVESLPLLPAQGRVLDIAMGLGFNAGLLVELGYQVVGVDIAATAVLIAKKKIPKLQAVIADSTFLRFRRSSFDVILDFYYLDRELWATIRQMLKPGGLFICETLLEDIRQVKPEINPIYLLKPEELRREFSDWEILSYSEGWTESDHEKQKSVASMVARSPQ